MSRPHRRDARGPPGAGRHAERDLYRARRTSSSPSSWARSTSIDVSLAPTAACIADVAEGALHRARPCRPASASGHLVIRPEFMRFLDRAGEAGEHAHGHGLQRVCAGHRIQYQVRVGDHVFVVEKLRQQAFAGQLDDAGADRLGRARQHPGARLMAMAGRSNGMRAGAAGWLAAGPPPRRAAAGPAVRRLRRAAAGGHRLQLRRAAHLRPVGRADAGELPRPSSRETFYISFLWSLGLAALTVVLLALICYPVASAWRSVFGPLGRRW